MTYEKFLAALRKTPRDWRLDRLKRIRCGVENHCPISAVTGNIEDYRDPVTAGVGVLNLDRTDAEGIIDTADNSAVAVPRIRADLLAACGIKEE